MSIRRIKFISHEASRTGAPIALLELLKNLDICGYTADITLLAGGPLKGEFEELYPTRKSSVDKLKREAKIKSAFARSLDLFKKNHQNRLAYLHSHSYEYLHVAKELRYPAICHVHEVPLSFKFVDKKTLELFKLYPAKYIAVSQYVQEMLRDEIGVPESRIVHIPTGIDTDKWRRENDGKSLRNELNIAPNAIVVGGSGQLIPLKGTDIWIRAAKKLTEIFPQKDLHFVWVGGCDKSSILYDQLMLREAEHLGIKGKVHLIGHRSNPKPYFEMFDVFALTSRLESFSMVCLENTLLGTPSVAFRVTGGPQEFGEKNIAYLVDGFSARCMAEKIVSIISNPQESKEFVNNASLIIKKEYDIKVTAGSIRKIIDEVYENQARQEKMHYSQYSKIN
ncbi:glycosyltransferase family 4 protein [Patescibacteria group bacterium]|nr:glycosyltransferase family 4 protein [Patescibacteria group bacterium]MBU1123417.1 glycosyltransferase family 4 protein [Patescibacteria group bacterium]MBU1911376.1 glycosyltransferase family 4 protein [Patescibacteria group bacterium]